MDRASTLANLPIPRNAGAETIAVPAERGPGHWVGAASVLVRGGVHYVAYRNRRPVDDGRGGDVIVGQVGPGGTLTELCRIDKRALDAESLERPALVSGWCRALAALSQLCHLWHKALEGGVGGSGRA